MGFRNIKIDSSIGLHIKNEQLVIGDKGVTFPLEDVNCVLIENQAVTISAYMLHGGQLLRGICAGKGAQLLWCGCVRGKPD